MSKDFMEFIKNIEKALNSGETEVYVCIGETTIPVEDLKPQERTATVLKILENCSDNFKESISDVLTAIDTAVEISEKISLKKEMIEDINQLLNSLSDGISKIRLEIKEK